MESALDKFQFIEISHLLSPKTNPKKPGAQPSDKPKAALSLCFEMEQTSLSKKRGLFFDLIVLHKTLQNGCGFSPCSIILRCKAAILFALHNSFFAAVFHRFHSII